MGGNGMSAKGPVGRKSRRALDKVSTCGVAAPDLSRGVVGSFARDPTIRETRCSESF